jgi:hypothetical protein
MLQNLKLQQLAWLIPPSVALAVYYVGLNNFFTWDDFIWLHKADIFKQNWFQMLLPEESRYFDPLVHLMFFADSLVGNFNHTWYHSVDLGIHALNSLLIYYFARLLGGDERISLYAGILFACSFAIADAVLWSSSRVDLVSTLFTLGALIQFLLYLRNERKRNLTFSFMFFVLALGAKGTPLILPLILFWLIIQEKKRVNYAICLFPFVTVVLLYLALLKLTMHQASPSIDGVLFNINNIVLAFCSLYIPEGILSVYSLNSTAAFMFIVVSVLCFAGNSSANTSRIRKTGYCILFAALLPMLYTSDFKLVTKESGFDNLLSSPSHRIYLSSVGAALIGGGFLRFVETVLKKLFPRFASISVLLLLAAIVAINVFFVRERDILWESAGVEYNQQFNALLAYRGQVAENSQIGTVEFIGSSGLLIAMLKVCLGINNITHLNPVSIEMINDMSILQKAEESFLFVKSLDGHVYDKSKQFRQQLLLNRKAILNPEIPEYASECRAIAKNLLTEIYQIIK